MVQGHENVLAAALSLWVGALGYYNWPVELPWLMLAAGGGLLSLLLLTVAWRLTGRMHLPMWLSGVALLAAAAGLGLAHAQMSRVAQRLDWQALQRPVWVQGRVVERYPVASSDRTGQPRVWLVLRDGKVFLPHGSRAMDEMRVTADARKAPEIGQGLAAQVQFWLPEPPEGPDRRDFQVFRYMDTTQLRGYVRGEMAASAVAKAPVPSRTWTVWQEVQQWFARQRDAISRDLQHDGQGVVPALLVGEERFIPSSVVTDYRASGLAHLLAISGFQLTVVGGGMFWLLRRGLNRVPGLALRTDTRVWAALLAWPVTVFYTLLAGAEVGLVRACLMTGVLFAAILLGRTRSLLRTWALVLLVMVALDPVVVLRAGFTLSFVAVLALIAWGYARPAVAMPSGMRHKRTPWQRLWQAARDAGQVSLVAGLATLPVVALYFGQVSLAGVLANTVAVPAMAVLTWLGMGVLVLWPLDAHGWLAAGMGQGVEWVNQWAHAMAALPLASLTVPHWFGWPALVLSVVTLGYLIVQRYAAASLLGGALVACSFMVSKAHAPWQMVITPDMAPQDWRALPVEVVWRTGNATDEDCRLADVIRMDVHGAAPRNCAATVLRDTSFVWAAMDSQRRWRVQAPICTRLWQQASAFCQAKY